MAKRVKKPTLESINREQAEKMFAEYAICSSRIQELNAKMEQEIQKIRDKYTEELTELSENCEAKFQALQIYAELNKADLFVSKKSLEFMAGTLGFRTGTPKLKTLKGHTWASVTVLLKEYMPDFIRTVEEPAKDMILAKRDDETVKPLLEKVGISVVQDESFYIDLKKEEAVTV
jgi:phage host-nuclease inhibitor protein Gam